MLKDLGGLVVVLISNIHQKQVLLPNKLTKVPQLHKDHLQLRVPSDQLDSLSEFFGVAALALLVEARQLAFLQQFMQLILVLIR